MTDILNNDLARSSPPGEIELLATQSYILCSNPRSGSTYLALMLASTGVLGFPWEWLRGDGGLAHHNFESYTTDAQQQVEALLRSGCTPNGVCAVKMFPEHFDQHTTSQWIEKLPKPQYVYLQRDDIVDQAISLSIARQTGSYGAWTSRHQDPIYDVDHIRKCLNFIALGENRWRLFFAINGITPLHLTYDEMVRSPQEIVNQVAALVGIKEAPINDKDITTSVQRDGTNLEWKARFISESRNLGSLCEVDAVANVDTIFDRV